MHDLKTCQEFAEPLTLTVRCDGGEQLWHLHAISEHGGAAAADDAAAAHPIAVSGIILGQPRAQSADHL